MKPQDILVLLKLHTWREDQWSIEKIAHSIGLSKSETHAAIKRSENAGLYSPITKKPIANALEEFKEIAENFKGCFTFIEFIFSCRYPKGRICFL